MLLGQRSETAADRIEVCRRKQFLRIQHFRMGDRRLYIVTYEALIERVVPRQPCNSNTRSSSGAPLSPEACHVLNRPPVRFPARPASVH